MISGFSYYGNKPDSPELIHVLDDIKLVAIDVESIDKDDKTAVDITFTTQELDTIDFRVWEGVSEFFPWHLLTDPTVIKIFHNCFFDLDCLDILGQEHGKIVTAENVYDTLITSHVLNKSPANLAWLGQTEVNMQTTPADTLLGQYHIKKMQDLPREVCVEHCCQDGQITMALYKKWMGEVDSFTLDYAALEMKLIPVLWKMSKRGIRIDQEVRARLEEKLTKQVEFYRSIAEGQGFNPGSSQQVGYILAKRGNFLPFTRSRKALQTDEDTLEFCDDPLAGLVLNYRKASKLLNTYIVPFKGKERIYTNFHIDAVTARISSKGGKLDDSRNLLNLPGKDNPLENVRAMLLPDTGIFTDFDYSQIELRFLAHLSQDLEMLDIYARNGDIHQETANFMGIARKGPNSSKTVNFAMIYGATPQTLMETAKIRDFRVAKKLMETWGRKYRGAWQWLQDTQESGFRKGYIETEFGRKIALPSLDIESEDGIKRKAVSYTIQGSAAEVMKRAILKCKELNLVLQVYDELLIDGKVQLPEGLDSIAKVKTPISAKEITRWE